MPALKTTTSFLQELAEFLASRPTPQQLLKYRPSKAVQRRAEMLLLKNNEGDISIEEKRELDQMACTEVLLRLIKAKLRLPNRDHG
jgi:hypothetical protein